MPYCLLHLSSVILIYTPCVFVGHTIKLSDQPIIGSYTCLGKYSFCFVFCLLYISVNYIAFMANNYLHNDNKMITMKTKMITMIIT